MASDVVVERPFEDDERALKEFDFYHGFIPRDDLPYLLRKDGDFLLRVSEVDSTTAKIKRDIILSIIAENKQEKSNQNSVRTCPEDNEKKAHKSMLRNVVVRRVQQSKFSLEADKVFDSLKEMVTYYQQNFGSMKKVKFRMRNAVKRQRWEMLHSDIKLGDLLGEGAFGEVRRGSMTWKEKKCDVAVKLTKGEADLCKEKIKEMMTEARLMRNLRHKNVVRLYGVAVDEQPLYIILELVKGGALNSYLEKNKGKVDVTEKLSMCLGAAQGVEFLHSKNIIHRDLAARNCLYTETKIVKISDFGLSRTGKEYKMRTKVKLPIKWLAPETIMKLMFSDKTDVYSFGVMIHEIFADGVEPWDGVSNADVKKAVIEGQMLPMKEAPDRVRVYCHEKVLVKDGTTRASMKDVAVFFDLLLDLHDKDDRKQPDGHSDLSKSSTEKTSKENSKYDQSIVDKSIVDKSMVDKSIVDRSIIDKSVLDKSVIDRSIFGITETSKMEKSGPKLKDIRKASSSSVSKKNNTSSRRAGPRKKKTGFHNKQRP